jgi:hypothetical protein
MLPRKVTSRTAAGLDGAGTAALERISIRDEILSPKIRRVTPDVRKAERKSRRLLVEARTISPGRDLEAALSPGNGPIITGPGFEPNDRIVPFEAGDHRTRRIRHFCHSVSNLS